MYMYSVTCTKVFMVNGSFVAIEIPFRKFYVVVPFEKKKNKLWVQLKVKLYPL